MDNDKSRGSAGLVCCTGAEGSSAPQPWQRGEHAHPCVHLTAPPRAAGSRRGSSLRSSMGGASEEEMDLLQRAMGMLPALVRISARHCVHGHVYLCV